MTGFASLLFKTLAGNISLFVALMLAMSVLPGCLPNVSRVTRRKDTLNFDSYAVRGKRIGSFDLRAQNYILYFTNVNCGKCANLDFVNDLRMHYSLPVYAVINESDEGNLIYSKNNFSSKFTDIIVDKSLYRNASVWVVPHLAIVSEGNYVVSDYTGNLKDKDKKAIVKSVEDMGAYAAATIY